jgi:hypothetical protein
MDQVSRPMQIALVAVVLFGALYFVALKPKSSTGGSPASAAPTAPGVTGLTNAIKKAHGAVTTSQTNANGLGTKSAQVSGDTTPTTTPSGSTTPAGTSAPAGTGTKPTPLNKSVPAAKARPIPHAGPGRAAAALADHKVLAVLFYNPRAADDRAVRKSFLHQKTHKGKVVLVVAPVSKLATYKSVTAKVAVTGSPTIVVLDRSGHPQSFVGFLDPTELANHIDDALAGTK